MADETKTTPEAARLASVALGRTVTERRARTWSRAKELPIVAGRSMWTPADVAAFVDEMRRALNVV